MDDARKNLLLRNLADYENQLNSETQKISKTHVSYGTAGFRGLAESVEHLFIKVGLVSGLISLYEQANVGVMITASHNHHQDNGVKLINKKGEMLDSEWEQIVEKFCNIDMKEELLVYIDDLLRKYQIKLDSNQEQCVFIGWDTRQSSVKLAKLVMKGLEPLRDLITYRDVGCQTTPIMHFVVAESNTTFKSCIREQSFVPDIISAYYSKLLNGIDKTMFSSKDEIGFPRAYNSERLVVDCSYGVGALAMDYLHSKLAHHVIFAQMKLTNTFGGILNEQCGADYVKTNKLPPIGLHNPSAGIRYASLDGDADRIVYFYLEQEARDKPEELVLCDGDMIMALFAKYLKDHVPELSHPDAPSLGFVQTAYANGASTRFLTEKLGVSVDFADTGVKNLQERAKQFDIGVYFEANGHGSIWLSEKAIDFIVEHPKISSLSNIYKLLINYTGDAISNLFLVEYILQVYDWNARIWSHELYSDTPNRLIKVAVEDRSRVKTTNAGRTCIEPPKLQADIDELVKQFGTVARCFVRPSGTEDVLRVYAEAETQDKADELAKLVGEISKKACSESPSARITGDSQHAADVTAIQNEPAE